MPDGIMKFKFNAIIILVTLLLCTADAQDKETVEITAQSILARVDRIMQYPQGAMQGRMKHIFPDGNSFTVDFKGMITRNDFLFHFSSLTRGKSLKVLYNMAGEDIWVYNIHALKLFHKMGVDKFDLLAATNFSFIDLSNSDYQSNYNARITGRTVIKGVDCYRLYLEPLYPESLYGALTMYVSVEKYHPLRIDFHDRDKVIFKFMTLAKFMENGDKTVPLRYDMLNIKDGTVTILSFLKFEENVKYQSEIFRPEKLGE